MCLTFMKNNGRTKKRVNCSLQDGTSGGMRSLQTSIVINSAKRCNFLFEKKFCLHDSN